MTGCFDNKKQPEQTKSVKPAPKPSKKIKKTPKDIFVFDASKTGKHHHIWVTDASEKGTQPLLKNYTMKATPGKDWMTHINHKVVFLARPTSPSKHNSTQNTHPHLLITDGTTEGTKRLQGLGKHQFETVASPFMQINSDLYFLGFDAVDQFSLYKTDTKKVEKVSANIKQAIGLDKSANFRLKVANNKIFLFTQVYKDNRIYMFQSKNNQWKELINTDKSAVAHPIQAVTLKNQLFVMMKKFGARNGSLYQVNTQTGETKLVDSNFLSMGIVSCYQETLCGFEIKIDSNKKPYFSLRTLKLEQNAISHPLHIGKAVLSPMLLKSFHLIDNNLYALLKSSKAKPSQTLHAISSDYQLSPAINVKDSDLVISDIAKRLQDTQVIQRHPVINGRAFLYAQANKKPACNGFDYEPWIIDISIKKALQLKDIMHEKNELHLPKGRCISSFTQQTKPIKLNGKILFIANGGDSGENPKGNELWVSDGTQRGTKILKDIAPGKLSGVFIQKGHSHGPSGHSHH